MMAAPRKLFLVSLMMLGTRAQAAATDAQMTQISGVTIPANQPAAEKDPEPDWVQGGGCDNTSVDFEKDGKPLGARVPVRKTNIMSPEFEGGHGFYPLAQNPPSGPVNDAMLQLSIAGPGKVAPNKPLKLSVSFKNRANKQLVVLRPNDGSLEHMRFPHYDLYLSDDKSGKVYRYAYKGGRCGNINPTRREDHVEIAQTQERNDVVNSWGGHLATAMIPVRGSYHLWVQYRFCGYESRGIPLGKDVRIAGVWRGAVSSNVLAIEVR